MVAPFSSGDLLALRVFPENDFAPYTSVWHCSPEGDWSIYNDGPSLETTCPRWWGKALTHASLNNIEVTWIGPNTLRVEMENPRLEWTMALKAPLFLRILNAINAALPRWTWKPAPLLRIREWISNRLLGMGRIHFWLVTPNGQQATIMPEEVFFFETSKAIWDGRDLGKPIRLSTNPTIGDVPLPTLPTFIIGQAYGRITDMEEDQKTRQEMGYDKNTNNFD